MAKADPTADTSGRGPGFWRRVGGALRLLVPLLLVPMLLGALLGGRNAATGAALGAFGGFMISAGAGWRTARWMMPPAILASGAAGLAYGESWWVVILLLAGVLCGVGLGYGLMGQVALCAILVAVAPPLDSLTEAGQYILFAAFGAVTGVLLARRAGIPESRRADRSGTGEAVLAAIGIGLAAGASAMIAAGWDSPHAYWLPLIVFLVVMPSAGLALHQRASARLLGTLLGAAFTLLLVPLELPALADMGVGFVCLVLAFVFPKPLWLNAAFTAAAIVLLLAGGGEDSGEASVARIVATGVGVVLVLVAAGVAALLARFVAPSPQERELAQSFEPVGAPDRG